MSSKTNYYLVVLVLIGALLGNTAMGFADVQNDTSAPAPKFDVSPQEEFMQKLKNQLNMSKTDYRELMNTVTETQKTLDFVSAERITLEKQLEYLDKLVTLSQEKLTAVEKQIVIKENEIKLTYEDLDMKTTALEAQKAQLSDYIKLMYQEEKGMITVDANGEIDALKLLLSDGTVGDNLKKLEYFSVLNEAGQQMVERLADLSRELRLKKNDLDEKRANLERLHEMLAEEKANQDLQKQSKENLLKITAGQEKIYQQLRDQSEKEQEQVLAEVKKLGDSLVFIEQKMAEDGANFDPNQYSALLDPRVTALYNFETIYKDQYSGLSWPINPERGLSAYFRDPNYMAVFGVRHNAIDIPIYQGSPVHAAANGVVLAARDNGYGYSYIILAHGNGYMTVYGHISEILVKEGDVVMQGAVVGLSGGMPGTKGAGYMTTGPHLHFEVLMNGNYVDPLDYLELSALTSDAIQNLPEKYRTAWEKYAGNIQREQIAR